ncbi:serine hydrolase [Pseudonocardia xinjiangensis]|uniref:Beta-lactamase n=2 Tax=Pseudonocardia xinjiangensis TaxID=75289 RepID=A0ABX1RN59_9PSEU|nr:serine hydrolase [Pseudonocardia xinjiangensis]NMH80785.1 serine hydrolase [Pseudonocardia xinjiangensis]
MTLSRRQLIVTTALLAVGTACTAAPPATTTPAQPRPIDSADALVDWIAAHPGAASVLVDDGRGRRVAHLADRSRPLASAAKVVHLTAYAQAVVAGRLDPDARVSVAEWERWYVPGTDGSAHRQALQMLGVGPDDTVRWDDLVAVMTAASDSAVPDLLRETLGDAALVAAATAGGWTAPDLPSFGGEGLLTPGAFTDDPPPGPADRRAAAVAALRRYAGDPAWRAAVAQRAAAIEAAAQDPAAQAAPPAADPALDRLMEWFDGGPAGTVAQLAGMHRAAATDGFGAEVAAIVRGHLERPLADRLPPGVLGAGQKGGSLPGILTNAVTVRRADATVGVAVVALSGMPLPDYQQALTAGAPLLLSQQVLLDDALLTRLGTAVGVR